MKTENWFVDQPPPMGGKDGIPCHAHVCHKTCNADGFNHCFITVKTLSDQDPGPIAKRICDMLNSGELDTSHIILQDLWPEALEEANREEQEINAAMNKLTDREKELLGL